MNAIRIGIDLAKNAFQVHGVGSKGKPVCRKKLTRAQLLPYFANLPPCEVGMAPDHTRFLQSGTFG